MVGKKTKSSFADRIAKDHEVVKGNETRVGSGGNLPPGIGGGVARLVDMKISVYAKGDYVGEPFFMAAATVRSPKKHAYTDEKTKETRVVSVRGLRTQLGPIPLCDTKNNKGKETPLRDHWDRMLNHLRLLGINTKNIVPKDVILEPSSGEYATGQLLKDLVKVGPTFSFRTWQGKPTAQYPNPRINEEWGQLCEDVSDTEESVKDNTNESTKWESEAGEDQQEPEEQTEKESVENEDSVDYIAIAETADKDPEQKTKDGQQAALALTEKAESLQIDYKDLPTWVDVANAITEAEGGSESEEYTFEEEPEEEEFIEEWLPVTGEIGVFNSPKDGKQQCEFIEVDVESETASVKRMDTKRITKKVPFRLLAAE